MQRIARDIKERQFQNIYLLYGEEDYLRKQYRDRLVRALIDSEDTMNYRYLEGKDISVEKLIDLAQTMPFLAERRVIVVENSGFFKSAQDKLADYLKEVPDTTCFIFVEAQIDKRGRLFKICKENGYAAEFARQTEETLSRWIAGVAAREDKKITRRALETFLEYVGSDMENISRELEKLLCYTLQKEDITEADVEAVCIRQIDNRIFDMIEAALAKRQSYALELYYDLIALREPPRRILFLITRQFHLLYQTKLLRAKGYDNKSIGSRLGLAPFIASKYMAQAAKYSAKALRGALEQCVAGEEAINTGRIAETLCVELLLIGFSRHEGVKDAKREIL